MDAENKYGVFSKFRGLFVGDESSPFILIYFRLATI